jgi:hypothetical protein
MFCTIAAHLPYSSLSSKNMGEKGECKSNSKTSITGHWHRDQRQSHWYSDTRHLSPVLENSGTGLGSLIPVPDCSLHLHSQAPTSKAADRHTAVLMGQKKGVHLQPKAELPIAANKPSS